MTIRANWHLDVEVDDSDPFDVREGERLDLTDARTLQEQLLALTMQEGRLAERGLSCQLKDRPDTCCSACPLRGSSHVASIRELCEVGQHQEAALMTMLAADA